MNLIEKILREAKEKTFDLADSFLKYTFSIKKVYKISRTKGFFDDYVGPDDTDLYTQKKKDRQAIIDRISKRINSIDDFITFYGLKYIEEYSGTTRATFSISWSWSTYMNDEAALLWYQDKGMGPDEVSIYSNSKEKIKEMYEILVACGLVKGRTKQ